MIPSVTDHVEATKETAAVWAWELAEDSVWEERSGKLISRPCEGKLLRTLAGGL